MSTPRVVWVKVRARVEMVSRRATRLARGEKEARRGDALALRV